MATRPAREDAPSTDDELRTAQARVAALEREHAEEVARANAALAAAQDRSYWLDRWQLDLNALMRRRGASELRAAFRMARAVFRLIQRARGMLGEGVAAVPDGLARVRSAVEQERAQAEAVRTTPEPANATEAIARALERAGLEPRAGDAHLAVGGGAAELRRALAGAYPGLATHEAADGAAALRRLAELHRDLEPGGRLILTVAGVLDPAWLLAHSTPDWRVELYLEADPDLYVLERR